MPEYTLRIRRYSPESGEAAHWEEFTIDLDGHRSVLDGILQAKDRQDGSIGIRCSCRAAICGSCGVRINGKPGLACHTHLDEALRARAPTATIVVEPMGNMPVLKDLIVDMDAVHWKKMQRVTPWLLPEGDAARARVHRAQGVDDRRHADDGLHPVRRLRLGLPVDGGRPAVHRPGRAGQGLPLRRRPARRPAGRAPEGPRRGPARHLRLHPLLQLHRGVPEGRRADEPDHAAAPDRGLRPRHRRPQQRPPARDGVRQEHRDATACCTRPTCCPTPTAASSTRAPCRSCSARCRSSCTALAARQGDAREGALLHKHKAPKEVKRIFRDVHDREERYELNLYVVGRGGGRADRRVGIRGPAAPAASCPQRGARTMKVAYWPGCVSRGFTPELHGSMAHGRPAARHRARRARPRLLLRRRRDRRAQPGARRHAQRPHVRARPAGDRQRRRPDDEHLLDLPGRAERVPGAPGREHAVPRPRQRDAVGRGPDLREGHHQQALPVAAGRGDRPRRRSSRRSSGR